VLIDQARLVTDLRATFEGLLTELVGASPKDLRPRLVLADLLTERGHPWGELIALSAEARLTSRLLVLLAEHEAGFCELVAPRARAAWVDGGLPEIAWYDSRDLLAVTAAAFPLLRQVAVRVARGHSAQVLSHPLLRHVTSLWLSGDHDDVLRAGAPLASLESLSLHDFTFDGLRELLTLAPKLRRLTLSSMHLGALRRALQALRAPESLEVLELANDELTRAEVLPIARGLGLRQLLVRRRFPTGGLDLDDADELAGACQFVTKVQCFEGFVEGGQLQVRVDPMAGDLEFLSSWVADQRARAARTNPLFALAQFRFLDAAPCTVDEHLQGDTLTQRRGCALSHELLDCFATLARGLPDARYEELSRGSIQVAPDTRVLSCWNVTAQSQAARLATLAPEVLRGLRTTGASSHVFSLGVLLFETLTGRLPHLGPGTPLQVLTSAAKGQFAELSSLTTVPPVLDLLVKEMLAVEPEHRLKPLELASRLEALHVEARADASFLAVTGARAPTVSLAQSDRYFPSQLT
jgi:uncharacterized protein (TIGR02996 family)